MLAQIEGLCDRVAILHRGKLIRKGRIEELVEEDDTDSLVVQGLSLEGRIAVENAIKAQGGHLTRVEKPRLSLDAYFLREVHQREAEHEEIINKSIE